MIARLWTGRVRREDAPRYLRLMNDVALPDYRATDGNLGAWTLHRVEGECVEVRMFTLWRDEASIAAFAGADITLAKYYDFDDEFLLLKSERVEHFTADQ